MCWSVSHNIVSPISWIGTLRWRRQKSTSTVDWNILFRQRSDADALATVHVSLKCFDCRYTIDTCVCQRVVGVDCSSSSQKYRLNLCEASSTTWNRFETRQRKPLHSLALIVTYTLMYLLTHRFELCCFPLSKTAFCVITIQQKNATLLLKWFWLYKWHDSLILWIGSGQFNPNSRKGYSRKFMKALHLS